MSEKLHVRQTFPSVVVTPVDVNHGRDTRAAGGDAGNELLARLSTVDEPDGV